MAEQTPEVAAPANANETADAVTTPPGGSKPATDPAALLRPPQAEGELGRLGPFRVRRLLGTGGMGAVFAAEDPLLNRHIALKVMRPELTASLEARERFLREARAAAALDSDYIVPVHQVGEDNGVLFIAMPLLKGETLDGRLKRDGRLSVPAALKVAREVAEALRAAHDAGLVHRDIKPANLWLEGGAADGPHGFRRVRVLDFGLARPVGDAHLTGNAIVGTPAYMSPEQASGQEVDARTDLFSLGSVLYQCLAGRLPFRGANAMAVLSALATTVPPPVADANPEVPAGLGALVSRLLSKDAAARPASAAAVAATVDALRADLTAVTVELPAPVRSRPRRRWGVAAGALLAGALAVLAGVIVVKVKGPDGKETEVTVPEGSKVDVDAKGNVTVTLPGAKPPPSRLPLAPMPRQVDPDELECVLKAGDSDMHGLVVLPDGETVVGGYEDGFVRVWSLKTRALVREFSTGNIVRALALHPNGRTLAVHTANRDVFTWDIPTGQIVRRCTSWLLGPNLESWSMDFSHDGKALFVADATNNCVWQFDTAGGFGRVFCQLPPNGRSASICALPNADAVVVHTHNAPVRLVRINDGRTQWEASMTSWSFALATNRAGTLCASRIGQGLLGLSDFSETRCKGCFYHPAEYPGEYHSVTISPNDDLLVGCTNQNEVHVWPVRGGVKPSRSFIGVAKTTAAKRVVFTSDGQRMITAHNRGTICVFRVSPEWAKPKPAYPPLDPAWLDRVQKLPPEEQLKEVSAELVRRNPGFDGKFAVSNFDHTGVKYVHIDTNEVEDISPVRAFLGLKQLGMSGKNSQRGKLWDLTPLKGMQLSILGVGSNPIWDLRPLQGMQLTACALDSTNVFDLLPLAGMKLDHLSLTMAPVRDLSPLRGMPFDGILFLHNFRDDVDLSPLKGSVLRQLTLPPSCRSDLAPLHETSVESIQVINPSFRFSPDQRKALDGVKTLKTINGKPVAEYWKEIDAEPPKK